MLSAKGSLWNTPNLAASMASSESREMTLPCFIWAVTIKAASSPHWRKTFLKTSVMVMLGTSNSDIFSMGPENTAALPSPAKYDNHADESTTFISDLLPWQRWYQCP